MSYLKKFGIRNYAIQTVLIILIVLRFRVRIHYRSANTFFSMQYCATMHSSDDDRTQNSISRRSFLGGTALVELPAVADNAIVIALADFPDLAAVGGSVVGKAAGRAGPIVIAHVEDGKFAALDATCTHMQCTVSYNPLALAMDCPCHDSSYEL